MTTIRLMRAAWILIFVAGFAGCSRCGSVRRPAGADRTELVVHMGVEPPHLNPLVQEDMWMARISINNIFEGLVRRHPRTYRFVSSLATRWTISRDGREILFTLRKGVKFHDGKPFGVKDVLFTFDRMMDPKVTAAHVRSDFSGLKKWEAAGPGEVRLIFEKPTFKMLESVSHLSILPKHVYGTGSLNTHPANSRPVGTGPFRFAEWKRGSFVRLRRYQSYWGKKAALDVVTYRLVRSKEKAFELLKKGEIDLMPRVLPQHACGPKAPIKDPRIQRRYRTVMHYPVQFYTAIFNMKTLVFQDVRVRRALAMLINRKLIAEKLFCGRVRLITGPYWIEKPGYNKKVKPYLYDPKKAAALLTEAGYADSDKDGVLDRNGKPLRFTYLRIAESSLQRRLAPILKEEFRRAGIDMRVDTVSWTQVLKRLKQHRFDLADLNWVYYYDQDLHQIYHSSQCHGGSNYGCYSNPRVDELLLKIRAALVPEKRQALERRLHAILHEDLPGIYLFNVGDVALVSRRFDNVYPSAEWYQVRDIRPASKGSK